MTIVLCVHFNCYLYLFPCLTNLKILMRVRKHFLSKIGEFTISENLLESYLYQEKNVSSWQFFKCSHKFVSSITGFLEGRHYNHGLLIDTCMSEALCRLYWDQFVKLTKVKDCEWRLDIFNNSAEELNSEFESLNTLENDQIRGIYISVYVSLCLKILHYHQKCDKLPY